LSRETRLLVELPQIGRVELVRGREAAERRLGGLDLAIHRHGQRAGVEEQRLLDVAPLVLVGPPDGDGGHPQQGDQGEADDGEQERTELELHDTLSRIEKGREIGKKTRNGASEGGGSSRARGRRDGGEEWAPLRGPTGRKSPTRNEFDAGARDQVLDV